MKQQDDLSKLKEPIFSRKKSLLTVGEYAARQGVSAGVVQEAAKLGVVQVRKHKHKTFIVDLPLDAYKIAKEPDLPPFEEIDPEFCANKIAELVNRICQPDNFAPPLADDSIHKVETEINDRQEIKSIPSPRFLASPRVSREAGRRAKARAGDWPVETLDLSLLAEEANELSDNRDINDHQLSRFRVPILRNIIESITSVSPSKIFFTLMTITFAVSISAYIWSSNDRKIQQQKLRGAYENISNLMTKYDDARQQAKIYELDMNNWQSEAQQAEKAITDYKAELESTKQSLSEARKDLQNTQRYNTDTLRKLNDQISKIRSQVPGPYNRPVE
jgi:Skp family chaperone for outer membrane proteins